MARLNAGMDLRRAMDRFSGHCTNLRVAHAGPGPPAGGPIGPVPAAARGARASLLARLLMRPPQTRGARASGY
jgi:hypothetical protein